MKNPTVLDVIAEAGRMRSEFLSATEGPGEEKGPSLRAVAALAEVSHTSVGRFRREPAEVVRRHFRIAAAYRLLLAASRESGLGGGAVHHAGRAKPTLGGGAAGQVLRHKARQGTAAAAVGGRCGGGKPAI